MKPAVTVRQHSKFTSASLTAAGTRRPSARSRTPRYRWAPTHPADESSLHHPAKLGLDPARGPAAQPQSWQRGAKAGSKLLAQPLLDLLHRRRTQQQLLDLAAGRCRPSVHGTFLFAHFKHIFSPPGFVRWEKKNARPAFRCLLPLHNAHSRLPHL